MNKAVAIKPRILTSMEFLLLCKYKNFLCKKQYERNSKHVEDMSAQALSSIACNMLNYCF